MVLWVWGRWTDGFVVQEGKANLAQNWGRKKKGTFFSLFSDGDRRIGGPTHETQPAYGLLTERASRCPCRWWAAAAADRGGWVLVFGLLGTPACSVGCTAGHALRPWALAVAVGDGDVAVQVKYRSVATWTEEMHRRNSLGSSDTRVHGRTGIDRLLQAPKRKKESEVWGELVPCSVWLDVSLALPFS